ncbi:flagellar biosynthesis protein FlhA [Alloiococcus sp. CFN-8]|uniref:flagellar biosynthesis protein FlhA n=1 Tax=Alloiococcus sp. CFN-8 TaxID=3416081 RepID=UPI003CEE1CA5
MAETRQVNIKNKIDIIVAFSVIGIVMMMIIPLPAVILDVLLVINITISLVILLITMFTTEVLQFSIFPTLLLITTLFRLGLNISSTRLILRDGDAGSVIEAFGNFVTGGNYIVGIIIFLIIIIIQFMVITNGAGRVSEVSARFTLDAMPGKQMSIDADLNAGLIDEQMARIRRRKLQQEADFYGAMDGASKFVKGDAIAGIIITVINILGGIILGIVLLNMGALEAMEKFTILTIGDGLVSQIPALLISTASGVLVTRAGSDENLGNQLGRQLTAFPQVIAIASVVLFALAFTGLPMFPFLLLSFASGISAYLLYKDEKEQLAANIESEQAEITEIEKREPENVASLISLEPLEVEIGYGLIPLADDRNGGDLLQRIASVRRQCAIEMGIIVQHIRIRDNLQIKNNQYNIKIRGTVIASSELMANMLLCMDPSGDNNQISGIKTLEPTFGLPAVWINKDQREEAEIQGLTVVDPTTVMVTHLTEAIKSHSYELLGRQETKLIIDTVKEKYSAVVEELIPDLMTIGEVQKVLQNLLRERVSIRDMATILESLADNSRNTRDIELLTEYVRYSLNRNISSSLIDESRKVIVATLAPELEVMLSNNLQKTPQSSFIMLEPDKTQRLFDNINKIIDTIYFNNNQPVILVSPKIRPAFKKLIEMVFPQIMVISLNEIPNDIEIKTQGVVNI